jgi:hypothetical protein
MQMVADTIAFQPTHGRLQLVEGHGGPALAQHPTERGVVGMVAGATSYRPDASIFVLDHLRSHHLADPVAQLPFQHKGDRPA